MAKEEVRNKRVHFGCQETAEEVQTGKGRYSEFTDKFVQIMEDSKKRDEDMFTNFFYFVSASDKRNASKLMEGFGKILKDIRKLKVYFYLK